MMEDSVRFGVRHLDGLLDDMLKRMFAPLTQEAFAVISSDLLPRRRIIDPKKVRSPSRALRRWKAGKRKVDPFSWGLPPAFRFGNTLVVSPKAFREMAKRG